MSTMSPLVKEFLAQKRIAVAGVTRGEASAPGNLIFRKLRAAGCEVYPINPRAETVEGARCYADLKSAPGPVDGVVLTTPPAATEALVRECAELGIRRVWMHRSFGQGSVSEAAVEFCRGNNIAVIAGGCPMMFCEPVDFGHRCMRWVLRLTGKLPE
jgi:predicted CoA-binding protein